ncbi:heterokaryon incompatibility protein-domain-containing protein [Exophiala viscosa]|uniref:Heterokaryon incompatibility protein-domain-containing protein n=1 Tax=Exophiala viscosa TaxID=2486360 RepID=A0AAN6E7X2_9EURO|nr:heterokaryon incompatibility protein-domain-containing protein [Exophiala viscosa]
MQLKILARRKLSAISCARSEGKPDDQPSYLLTKDHGLNELGLCRDCSKLEWLNMAQWDGNVLKKNHWDILATRSRCRLCALIASTIRDMRQTSLKNVILGMDIPQSARCQLRLTLRGSMLHVSLDGPHRSAPIASFELYCEPAVIHQRHDLSHEIKDVLPHCCRGILQSQQDMESHLAPVLPFRVLDLGLTHSYDPDTSIQLHITTESERAGYVALSHRWGLKSKQQMPSRTTLSNLGQQRRGIEFNRLPRTFQDAVTVTRMLGFRYLWIDALCIIQDDPDDWRLQSASMGTIFKHASMTVAVHSARTSAEGFLWRREVPEYLSIQPERHRDDTTTAVYTRIPKLSDAAIARGFHGGEIIKRGWCLQELCLSQRILHFVEDDMIWECAHQPFSRPGIHTQARHLRTSDSVQEGLKGWLSIVEHYSSCQLTKTNDKLAAVAGLASVWPTQSDYSSMDSYHFGIWAKYLHTSLLWMQEGAKGTRLVKRLERAPTWSWASVDGEIKFYPSHRSDTVSKADIDLISFNYPETGQQTDRLLGGSCSLRLRAVVVEGLEVPTLDRWKFLPFAPSQPRYFLVLYEQSKRVGWASPDEPWIDGTKLLCIRIASKGSGDNHRCYVLITKQDEKGEHIRLGMGCIFRTEILDNLSPRVISIR